MREGWNLARSVLNSDFVVFVVYTISRNVYFIMPEDL